MQKEFFVVMTAQWQHAPGRTGLATSSGEITCQRGTSTRDIYNEVLANLCKGADVSLSDVNVIHFSITPALVY